MLIRKQNNLLYSGKVFIGMVLVWIGITGTPMAQEKGPLMMEVELGFTLGGIVLGAGLGALVWFTDPLGPTDLAEAIEVGAVMGTVLGAILGFYVLQQAVIFPQGKSINEEIIEQFLGKSFYTPDMIVQDPLKSSRSKNDPALTLNLLSFKF